MRAQKSAKNIIVALISNALNIVLGVVVQSIFLKTLGEEYLGLNTVLTSILSMLSIAELGLGSAIIYNMYKPIANKDKEKIKSLMKLDQYVQHTSRLYLRIYQLYLMQV